MLLLLVSDHGSLTGRYEQSYTKSEVLIWLDCLDSGYLRRGAVGAVIVRTGVPVIFVSWGRVWLSAPILTSFHQWPAEPNWCNTRSRLCCALCLVACIDSSQVRWSLVEITNMDVWLHVCVPRMPCPVIWWGAHRCLISRTACTD